MLGIGVLAYKMSPPHWLCIVIALISGGCVADIFGDRAASYNQEAATSKDTIILTNIIRASLGRPLQFTDLTTVSGTASQSLSVAGVFPFAVHRPPTVGISDTVTPAISLSGGPTFSVANLSTKEFYSGILNPLQTPILGYYLSEGRYPLNVLLTLAVSGITFIQEGDRIEISNSLEGEEFQDTLNKLLFIGLATERVDKPIAESPALSEGDAKDAKLLASLASGAAAGNTTLDLKRYDVPSEFSNAADPNLSLTEHRHLREQGESMYFRLEKKNSTYKFCFQKNKVQKQLAARGLPYHFPLHLPLPLPRHDNVVVSMGEQNICGVKPHGAPDLALKKLSENLEIETRSVLGIIDFLGKIVRSGARLEVEKDPQGGSGSIVIFTASEQPLGGPNLSATVDGKTYYVKVDADAENQSSRVLELVAELIALNSSAKDLPAPNVITVISP